MSRKSTGLCRNCGREPASRPRGLGWRCYYIPGVRDLYPDGRPENYAPERFRNKYAKEPSLVCGALPGSEDKVRVLEDRVLRGEACFHEGDARHTEDE